MLSKARLGQVSYLIPYEINLYHFSYFRLSHAKSKVNLNDSGYQVHLCKRIFYPCIGQQEFIIIIFTWSYKSYKWSHGYFS
jgi:hypothetical protein